MKRGGVILTVFLSILALIVGFGGTTAALIVTQPAIPGSSVYVNFQIGQCGSNSFDTAASIAQRLQADGLIRNALAFRVLAGRSGLDRTIKAGNYQLSPHMTMGEIIQKLQQGHEDLILAGVNEGKRVTEYANGFSNLQYFDADKFNEIVKTGALADGTKLSDKYWFVEPQQTNTYYALEGYLYPDHFKFQACADEEDVVGTLLDTFGKQLCPGGDDQGEYFADLTRCKAHAATVDSKGTTVFATLEKYYGKDDRKAVYLALIIASLTIRESPGLDKSRDSENQGIASVYYNRWQHALQNPSYTSDAGSLIQSDPTVQYAVATDNPPKDDGTWWPNINDQDLKSIETKNEYNTYVFPGLPPGPIAAPVTSLLLDAANPVSPDAGKLYYYFISGKCDHKTYFAQTADEQNANIAKYINNAQC